MSIVEQTDNLEHLFQEAVLEHAEPLWPKLGEIAPPAPTAKATPYLWSYERLRPFCERAARLVGTELAERRVFMLINPTMKPPHTTDTLYAGLQTILPGETARAEEVSGEILRICLRYGGSITGEHGVGHDKAAYMGEMFTDDDLETMARLRCAFDPGNQMNPGKVFPTPRLCGDKPGLYRAHPTELSGEADRG